MEIKVLCDCGTKYKFDAEPVNGQMPYTINCPGCGIDGTNSANSFIQASQPSSAPVSVAPAQPRIRLNVPVHAAPTAPPAPEPPAYSAPPVESYSLRQNPSEEKSIAFGIAGAAIAGFVGMMIWFYLIKWTGYEIGYAAWGVGFLTGIGARVAGSKASTALGVFAGACALVAIIGGQYLAVKAEADKFFDEMTRESYNNQMTYAKAGVAAQSDAEIKALLAKKQADEDEKPEAIEISDQEIKDFREKEVPVLKDFINGKPDQKEFEKGITNFKGSFSYNLLLLKGSVGLFTLLWLFLGVGSAYKLASGASGD